MAIIPYSRWKASVAQRVDLRESRAKRRMVQGSSNSNRTPPFFQQEKHVV